MAERLAELRELQDAITAPRRDALIGATVRRARRPTRRRPQPPRGAGDRRHRAIVADDLAVGRSASVEVVDAVGATWSPPERTRRVAGLDDV